MATKAELEQENEELLAKVFELGDRLTDRASDPDVIDENLYPRLRFSYLAVSKSTIAHDLARHQAAMNEIIKAGNYTVVNSHLQDAVNDLALVVVMQRLA